MQCPNCKFENIPGQTKCFSCGCILESEEDFDPTPPRASAWKKINSRTTRIFRKVGLRFRFVPSGFIENLCWNELIAVGLSIVPGLSQILQGRFRQMWWAIALWGFSLIGGLLLLGTDLGAVLIAVCISTHAFLISNSILLKLEFWRQILLNLLMTILIAVLYIQVIWHGMLGLNQLPSAILIPSQNITANTQYVTRRVGEEYAFTRGELVAVNAMLVTNHGGREARDRCFVQVVGLPGETIKVEDGQFFCNDIPLDIAEFPVQKGLMEYDFTTELSENQYFLNINYQIERNTSVDLLEDVFVFERSQINGKSVMRLPIWNTNPQDNTQ